MQFKIDENLPVELADLLAESGHDAATAFIENLVGSHDDALIRHCLAESRTLITLDLDFGDIRAYPPKQFAGVIVLRLRRQDNIHVIDIFKQLLGLFATENPHGKLWIVEEDRIRIRE
jgi:predicted nuclease of predicted toxin-antitoxin system